jgi:glycosyltransferase involved in cell wall biosynthesis
MLLDRLTTGGGGAEVFTVGLAKHLPRERFDVRVCATRYAKGFLVEELRDAGIPLVVLDRHGRADLRPLLSLRRYLRRERIDVLHAHMFGSNFWGTVIGRLAGTPAVIAHEHTWSYQGQPLRKLIDGRVIGRLAGAFVAVSSADRRRMIELEHVPPEKTVLIPAGFVPRPRESSAGLRVELGIPAGAPLVGTVMIMRPQKALPVMIDAIGLLRRSVPDAHLVVVGEGPCFDAWVSYAAEQGLRECVHFTGPRRDVGRLIETFDVSALSSDFEGTPLFVFESIAHETPIVATDVGGLRDVLEDGSSALLVPPRDPAALAGALAALLQDGDRAAALARAASERLPEFSIERIAGRFASLYADLLTAGG